MEIILKKTKITNSILKQTLRTTENDFKVGEILGWCIYGSLKYIVVFNKLLNTISKFPLFKEVVVKKLERGGNMVYMVEVKLLGCQSFNYTCNDKSEVEAFLGVLNSAKETVTTKGQFFI